MNQKTIAATRNTITLARADAGALAAPWPEGAFAGMAAGFAGGLGGAAESFGGGGGHVMVPSFITVVPRITSSSMLTLRRPSFALHNSSVKRSRFVA